MSDKKYYFSNRDKILKQQRKYRLNNRDKIRKKSKEYRLNNKEKMKKYYLKNKEKIQMDFKKYYLDNRDKFLKQGKEYTLNNKEKISILKKKYSIKNREKIRKYGKDNRHKTNLKDKERWYNDQNFNTKKRLRNLLRSALRRYAMKGKYKSSKQYGINYKAIIEHLKPFPKDISLYHIDHIKPLCSFDLTNDNEIKKAFEPKNHQWLLAKDNQSKGGKIE